MALRTELGYKLGPDKSASANNHDLHRNLLARNGTVKFLSMYPNLLSRLWSRSFRHRHQRWSALVLEQQHDKLCRLRTARVLADDMDIVAVLVEGLSWFQGYRFATLHLHNDG